jgi:hypothetical protein
MNNFLNLILLGKGIKTRPNIGGNTSWDERDGMIMDVGRKVTFFGGGKNNLVAREYILEVKM